MPSRSGSEPSGPSSYGPDAPDVTAALDRLYAAPLDGFVAVRRELAGQLKAGGDVAASRLVGALAKPSRTAWALNQVARKRPALVQAALDAHVTAQAVQKGGDAEAMRASARAYRDRVTEVIALATQLVHEDGSELASAQGRRIGATLQAVATGGDPGLREALVKGQLVGDVDVEDPFAGLELGPRAEHDGPRGTRAAPATAARSLPHEPSARHGATDSAAARAGADAAARQAAERERQARAQEREVKRARLAALETEAKEARASAREAEVTATRAQSEAERARRAVEAIEKRIEEARRDPRGDA